MLRYDDGFGPLANNDPADDGADNDSDGLCDSFDTDDDNDGLSDVAEAAAGTDPFDPDSDNDGFQDGTDTCPAYAGQVGDFCDADGGPGYTLGQIGTTGSFPFCGCSAVACNISVRLNIQTDGAAFIGWSIYQQGSNVLVHQSAPVQYPANLGGATYGTVCLPDGDFYLVVTSSTGLGFGAGGGYRLETLAGQRLVDNTANFNTGSVSQIAGGQGFDLPAGVDRLIYTSCDKMDWRSNEYIVANDNPAVAAYHGGPNAAQTGYEMWFYDPNGGYSFRRFHSHAVSDGFAPNNPQRACHIKVNGWGGVNTIPAQSDLLNVKVRGRIMVLGVPTNLPWGPACRFKMDANRAACPLTHLMDVPGNVQLSCGATRAIGTGGANLVHARPVNRYLGGVSTPANRYQFKFIAETTTIKTSATGQYWVNTAGLNPCVPYEVYVRASFDNGVTWCDTYAPALPNPFAPRWGRMCILNTACAAGSGNQNVAALQAGLNLYPNPNNGEQLFLSIDMVKEGVEKVNVDIFDSFGKRVNASTIAVNEGFVNTTLDLNGSLAAGMYIVNITAGDDTYTERLVIQP
ncbi:MAG: T9SS type A sorting domain-containing protein [Flavobacteriales bacterium]|nr:T9SS type A sorting domain-containing protein [Flavobacteriales bacterium]